jgi:hypothetical protein
MLWMLAPLIATSTKEYEKDLTLADQRSPWRDPCSVNRQGARV